MRALTIGMIKPEEDQELVRQLRQGNHNAFNKLYDLYKHRLFGNLYRILKDRDTVEELVQDLFMNVWKGRQQIDPERPFKAYLFQIAANLAKNSLRKAYNDQKMRTLMMASAEASYTHIEEQLFREENKAQLEQLLNQLPPQRKRVYMLCKLEGRSYREVSELLGISESAVNDHIKKANTYFATLRIDPLFVVAFSTLVYQAL